MKNLTNRLKPFLASLVFVIMTSTILAQSQKRFNIANVHALSVSSDFEVELRFGAKESLVLEADNRLMNDLIGVVRGGVLTIGLRQRSSRRSRFKSKAYLTVKSLDEINLSGGSSLQALNTLSSRKLEVQISGSSTLNLKLNVGEIYFEASGNSIANMEGFARDQIVRASGTSSYRAFNLKSEIANIRVTNNSSALLSVSNQLDARATSNSRVRYRGNPRVSKDTSSGGTVRKSN